MQPFDEILKDFQIFTENYFYYLDYKTYNYKFVSPADSIYFGYTQEEINQISFNRIIKKIEKLVDAKNEKLDVNSIYMIVTKSGEKRWVNDKAKKIKSADGQIIGQAGVLVDITDKRDIENSYREVRSSLQNILDYSPIGIAVIQNNKFVYVNKIIAQILALKNQNSVIGKNIVRYLPKKKVKEIGNVVRNILSGEKKIFDFHEEILNSKSESILVEGQAISISFNGEKAIQVIVRDVSDKEKSEKAKFAIYKISEASDSIEDINEFYKFVHKTISEIIPAKNFFVSVVDKKSGYLKFPYFVDEFENIAEPRKFGKGLTEFLIRKQQALLIDKAENIKLLNEGEIELIGEPSKVWLGVPLKIKSEIIGAIVLQDYKNISAYNVNDKILLETISYSTANAIERRIRDEEKEKYILELKEMNNSKDRLLAIISHDLKSPFSAMLGYQKILLDEIFELSKEEVIELLTRLNETSISILDMMNKLLEYSRFHLGRNEFKADELNLNDVIDGCAKSSNLLLEKKSLILEKNLSGSFTVLGHQQLLSSIINNLLKIGRAHV